MAKVRTNVPVEVIGQFHDAVDAAFEAGWNAAMDAKVEDHGDNYVRGFVEQIIYQETSLTMGDTLARSRAERAAKALMRACEVKIIERED